MRGGIDLFLGKRTHYHKCVYWKRDDDDKTLEEITHENAPNGRFYAKQENNRTNSANIIAGVFMFDNETITLSTNDKVDIIKNDIVYYENQYWNIVNVQEVEIHKNSEFMSNVSKVTYIQLRR